MNETDTARIRALIHPLSLDDFLTECWPTAFHHFSDNAKGLASLISQPELRDIDSLARCPNSRIRAFYTRDDRPYERGITAERAIELYKSGCTIAVNTLITEEIKKWNVALDSALGLLPGTATMNAFASTPGKGVHWHWDSQELFIVQVQGRKLWRVAANEYVEWPSENGRKGAENNPILRHQLLNPSKHVEAPTHWEEVELRPGSVLFLPRGYWHTCENIDESLHLILQVKLPSWRDVFLFILQYEPESFSLPWRQPTDALRPENLSDAGVREFVARCARLTSFASSEVLPLIARRFGEQSPSIILGDY